jgi:small subunit ribosomal protein S6
MDKVLYEILYIIDAMIDEPAQQKVTEDIKKIIQENGGEIVKESHWGKQNLAFPIKKRTEGIYVNMEFKAPVSVPDEIKQYELTHASLLRQLTLRVPKAKLVQEQRDEQKKRRELEEAEKARKAALAAEAKKEMEAAMAENQGGEAKPETEAEAKPEGQESTPPAEPAQQSAPAEESKPASQEQAPAQQEKQEENKPEA